MLVILHLFLVRPVCWGRRLKLLLCVCTLLHGAGGHLKLLFCPRKLCKSWFCCPFSHFIFAIHFRSSFSHHGVAPNTVLMTRICSLFACFSSPSMVGSLLNTSSMQIQVPSQDGLVTLQTATIQVVNMIYIEYCASVTGLAAPKHWWWS